MERRDERIDERTVSINKDDKRDYRKRGESERE